MKMSAIQKVVKQALVTFGGKDASCFLANFEKLDSMVSKITHADINIKKPAAETKRKKSKVFGAPVSYINICESPHFTLGVFVLRSGVSIPLHDHPGMHGICKVLYGSVKVRSYDPISSNDEQGSTTTNGLCEALEKKPVKCRLNADKIYSSTSETCTLMPNQGNYHSIQAYDGQAAFLDILAPPYVTGERDCAYYEECNVENASQLSSTGSDSVKWLVEIPQPLDFYCDSMPYEGPVITTV